MDIIGTDSPFRETSNIYDGSAFCADMAVQVQEKRTNDRAAHRLTGFLDDGHRTALETRFEEQRGWHFTMAAELAGGK